MDVGEEKRRSSLTEDRISNNADDTKRLRMLKGKAVETSISGCFFKGLSSQIHGDVRTSDSSKIMRANPAALSRSLDFHECM
ncbi:unnamed protein product [Victoria cruziana]